MIRTLVIGIGNPLRRDDGLGWAAVRCLDEDARTRGVETMTCHQLNPEMAEDIAGADRVIFVDAAIDGRPGEIRSVAVTAAGSAGSFSHQLNVETLMGCVAALYQKNPEAFVVTMTGTDYGVGEGLSDAARHGLPYLIHRIEELIDLDSTQGGPTRETKKGSAVFREGCMVPSGVTIRD